MPSVFGIVLAGGEGKRLMPLTADRAKPAVPFGGHYRLIDFALSNLVNAGFLQIVVLTQYKSHSLDRHITTTWRLSPLLGNYVTPVPAQMRRGPRWFAGSADAIYQNLNLIYDERPGPRLRLRRRPHLPHGPAADDRAAHRHRRRRHGRRDPGADRPVEPVRRHRDDRRRRHDRALPGEADRPRRAARRAGQMLRLDGQLRVHDADADRRRQRGRRRRGLQATISAATSSRCSSRSATAHVYDFSGNDVPGASERDRGYWRDVGTLDTYYDAHMDLVSTLPVFNLYNQEWPIHSWPEPLPPAKFVVEEEGRTGQAINSMVCAGVIVSGGRGAPLGALARRARPFVRRGRPVRAAARRRGRRGTRSIRNAILDKNVRVAEGAQIGVDLDRDRDRFVVSDGGIVVIGKNAVVEA